MRRVAHADAGISIADEFCEDIQDEIRGFIYIYILYTRYILYIIVTPELLYKQRQLPMSDLWTALLCSPMKPGLTAFTFILRFTLHPQ